MALPTITLTGNLTQEVEFNTTKTGKSVANLKIACNEKKFVNNQWIDGDTIYLTAIVWGQTAENAVVTLQKGDAVTIVGKLTQRTYTTKANVEKTVYEINVDSLAADLRRFSYTRNQIVKTTPATIQSDDAWSQPLSDNSVGVNF